MYPLPALVIFIAVTAPFVIVAVAVAVVPPPPGALIVILGAEL